MVVISISYDWQFLRYCRISDLFTSSPDFRFRMFQNMSIRYVGQFEIQLKKVFVEIWFFRSIFGFFSQKTGVTTTPPHGDATCVILYDQFRIMNKHKICTFMHGIIAEYRVDLYLCQHSIVMSLVMSWSTSSSSHRLVIVKSSTQSLGIDYTFIFVPLALCTERILICYILPSIYGIIIITLDRVQIYLRYDQCTELYGLGLMVTVYKAYSYL